VNGTVVFQGENGAYSHEVAKRIFKGNMSLIACKTFCDTLLNVSSGKADYAVLPMENSVAGSVVSAYDELLTSNLQVVGEVILKINHCLLVNKGVNLNDISIVYSHPQALSQCVKNCKSLELEQHPFYDTAGAAKYISENKSSHVAAIASSIAANIYNLTIAKVNFEDEIFNSTRFFIIQKSTTNIPSYFEGEGAYKTSIIFRTSHTPNALGKVLSCLADNDINLTKIESRPSRKVAWEYVFFVDFMGHKDDQHIRLALSLIKFNLNFLRVIGSYKSTTL
jgi:prephenate dehydratase